MVVNSHYDHVFYLGTSFLSMFRGGKKGGSQGEILTESLSMWGKSPAMTRLSPSPFQIVTSPLVEAISSPHLIAVFPSRGLVERLV